MYFLVHYRRIDIESHALDCIKATEEQMMDYVVEANREKFRVITNKVCNNECDMQVLCGDGPGVLIVVRVN